MMTDRLLQYGFSVAEGRHLSAEGTAETGQWAEVILPHDANILRDRLPKRELAAQGFTDAYHDVTYSGTFSQDALQPCQRLILQFDGVYRNCEVFLNGKAVGTHGYGYTSFWFDITDAVVAGENRLEVYVDGRQYPACRWYSGLGIYRDLHLLTAGAVHVKPFGTLVTAQIDGDTAAVSIRAQLRSTLDAAKALQAQYTVLDPQGAVAAEWNEPIEQMPGIGTVETAASLGSFKAWDIEDPQLYTLEILLSDGETVYDRYTTRFGIRDIRYDADKGFFLNGRPLKFQGVDLHHDSGCLGSAFLTSVWRERLCRFKKMGVNFIRTSHNPQAPQFYDLCDELGLMVMDEAFDKWNEGQFYYTDQFDNHWEADLVDMLERDGNHPCIVCWSVGNEIPNQARPWMCEVLKKLTDRVKAYDRSRPVTFALDAYANPIRWDEPDDVLAEETAKTMEYADFCSTNYTEHLYEKYREKRPDRLILGTEIFQYYSSIGSSLQSLNDTHPWEAVKNTDYVLGGVIWSGSDYLGESIIWPSRGWTGAPVDISYGERPVCGLWKAYWLQQPTVSIAVFDSKPSDQLANTWWAAPELVRHTHIDMPFGQFIRVATYSNCESVEVYADGKRMGEQQLNGAAECFWLLTRPGMTVTAIGKNGGVEVCRDEITTHGEPAMAKATCSLDTLVYDPHCAAIVELELFDREGRRVYTYDRKVQVTASEGLALLGIDNGDTRSHHAYKTDRLSTYKGRLALVVRAKEAGERKLTLTVDGMLEPVTLQW